jgi:phage repressor protein C with HTH and peptisase S24 domain
MTKIWRVKLEEIMAERGLKAKPLSRAAGLNETYIRDLLQKDVDPTVSKLSALADTLGLPVSYFFGNEEMRSPGIPVAGYASGGDEWQPLDDGESLPTVDFATLDLSDTDAIAIRVRGHSMSPVFRDGDDLICSRRRGADMAKALNCDCVVKTIDNRYFIKQLLKGTSRGSYRLRSYNTSFPDIENAVLEWVAPVIWIKRKS